MQGMDVNYIVESGLEDEMRQAMEQYSTWLLGQVGRLLPKTLPKQKLTN
jgi:hypothetical protein